MLPQPRTTTSRVTTHRPVTLVVALITMMLACLGACRPEQASHGDFRHIPQAEGWNSSLPVALTPVYPDSNARYDIELAIRHTTRFPYKALSLVVDLQSDSLHTVRKNVTFDIADDRGNWLGAGFGNLYQCHTTIATQVTPQQVERVVVWQTTTDTINLRNVTELGILVHPRKP